MRIEEEENESVCSITSGKVDKFLLQKQLEARDRLLSSLYYIKSSF
jgi:hypothetical protein